ncbi:MAG: hypothetical protein ACLUAR_10365 [Pilosibacter sp.]
MKMILELRFWSCSSWLKEVQEFHLNQVGLEHESVYLKLLGIERKEICPARTVVTCCSVKEETELPEGFQFHAGEIPFCSVERTRLFSGKLWRVRTGNTGRQGYVSEREWDGSDTGWKLPVFTETPEYGNFLEMEFAGKMTGGQTFGFFFRIPEERSAKRNPVSEEFEPLVGIRAECKDNGSDSWKICELVRDDTHAFLYSGIIKIRIPDEMGESGADRIRFVFSEGEYDVVPVLSEILLILWSSARWSRSGRGFWGRGQDSQIRDSRWRAPGQFRPQWNWKQKLLSIREYLNPGDVSVIFRIKAGGDRHFVVDGEWRYLLWRWNPRIAAGRNHPSDTAWQDRGVGGNVKKGQIHPGRSEEEKIHLFEAWNFEDVTGGADRESTKSCFERFEAELAKKYSAVTKADYEGAYKACAGTSHRTGKGRESRLGT